MDFVPLIALSLVVKTTVDILRYLRAADWNGAGTLLVVWLGGFAAAALFAQTAFAEAFTVGTFTLGDLNVADLVVLGLTLGSGAAGANELFGALDRSRSTAKPHLIAPDGPE